MPPDMIAQPKFEGRVKIIVKPNSKEDKLLGWDDGRKAWKVAIAAPAEDNRANIAVVRFFSKLTKKNVRIVAGFTSRQKVLFFVNLPSGYLNCP